MKTNGPRLEQFKAVARYLGRTVRRCKEDTRQRAGVALLTKQLVSIRKAKKEIAKWV